MLSKFKKQLSNDKVSVGLTGTLGTQETIPEVDYELEKSKSYIEENEY